MVAEDVQKANHPDALHIGPGSGLAMDAEVC